MVSTRENIRLIARAPVTGWYMYYECCLVLRAMMSILVSVNIFNSVLLNKIHY